MNQNDLILANAGIPANIDESAQSPIDQALHDAYQNTTIPSVTEDKLNLLAQRKQEKLAGLAPKYSVAKIDVGDDADTPRINNQSNTTRIRGIDSFETYHGEDWLTENRSHVNQQKAVLERQMGRPVTDQEVFAAGERQKDEVNDWFGGATDNTGKPLPALGLVEQTLNKDMSSDEKEHLYGRNLGTVKKLEGAYTDMQGNEVLPQDETWGSDHVYSRNDPYEYNPINKNVNLSAVQEEANKKAERDALWESIAGDKDGMFGESVDIAQSSLIQQYGKTNKALREMSRWAAGKLGVEQDTIDEWLPTTDKVGTIGFGDTTSADLAKREVADKMTGVMAKTREEQDTKMKEALANVEKGNYGEAGLDVLTIMPYVLGDSTGEIASLMAGYPGVALAVAGRVNEDAEEFKKNNDGKDVSAEWLMGSTLANLGVLVGERLVVGKVLGDMTKGLSNTLAQKGKDVFYSTLGETAQEYADQTQQMYMTQKEGTKTLEEVATSPEAQLAALTGGAMGGVTSGTGFAGSAAIGAADKGLEVLDEKIKYNSNSLDDPERVNKPIGTDGKFNMWDSVGAEGFKVENPKSKEIYAETIAEFAVDLHMNPEAMVKYGYRSKEADGGKNIGSVLQDATDKMAAVYDLTSPKAKEVAKYMLVQKLVNYTRSKSTEKGEYKIAPEQQQEMLKEVAEFVKGNKPAEVAFLDMQKEEIKAAFQGNVDIKKADKFMEAYGLDSQTNGQIIADLMTLDDKQYADLQKAVKSMKLMGSSDSVIMEDMGAISEELDKLRNKAKILGSAEGTTGGDTGTPQKKRKTYQDVANEVRNIGFMTRSGFKKSARDHARDIETTVGVEGMPQATQTKNIELLETFVNNRGIDKVRPFRIVGKEASKVLNTVAGIKNILRNKMEESAELSKIIDSKLKQLDAKTQPELIEKFTEMQTTMRENQNSHSSALAALESKDPEVRKQAYMKLNAGSTKLDKEVLTEMLEDPESKWDTKGWEENYENVDTTEAEMELESEPELGKKAVPTGAEEGANEYAEATQSDTTGKMVNAVADKIVQGKELNDADLQVQDNEGAALEKELKRRAKLLDNGPQETNKYAKETQGDETAGSPTVKKSVVETATEAKLDEEPKVKTRKEELAEVEKTVTYIDWLDKQLANALADRDKIKSKHKILKGLQREYLVDIAKAKRDLHGVRNEMYGIAKLKDKVEKAGEGTYVRAMNKFKGGLKQLANIIRALKGAITKYLKKIVALKDAENVTAEELGELELQMRALGKKIGLIEKAKKQAKVDEARTVRAGMEEMLGDLVKPNNKLDNSLSALISKDASTAEIMKLMPNIISKNENGVRMVEDAVENLQEFAAMRVAPGQEIYPNNWFTTQYASENGYVNPIRDFALGDKGMSFENLWKLEPEKEKDPEYKKYKNEIRSHVKNAMNIASVVVLKDMIDVRLNNSEQMRDTVDDGFAPVWNEIGSEEASAQKAKIRKEIKAGKYVPEAVFRENAGRFMMEQLELQLSPDLTIQERPDLQTALGVLVINNLLPAGRVTLENGKEVSVHDTRKDGGKPLKNTIRRGVVAIEKGTAVYKDINKETDKDSDTAVRVINLEELQKDYISKVSSMATVFEFASAKDDGQISLKPIVKKDDATIKNSDVPLAQGVKDYLNREGSRPWKFVGMDEKVAKAKEEAEKIVEAKKVEGVKDFKYSYVDWFKDSILGTEDALIAKTATMNMDSEIAKYRAEELIIERMLIAHELVGDGNKFYIGWDYTVSGRSMMSGKLINPQSSGISRFLVAAEDMITKIDAETVEQKSIDHLELAVAQALDVGIDKTSAKNGLNKLHKQFVQIVKKDGKLELKWSEEGNQKLKKLVEDPEFNIGNVRKLDEALAEVMKADPSAAKLEAGSKTIMHLVQAVELLREIESGKTKIETNLALEADGITNGMAIVLMQMGWSGFTQELLKKAGVYAKDDEFQNHGDYKDTDAVDENGNKILDKNGDPIKNTDIYESPIEKIEKSLGTELTAQIDELIGGKWRNFMKNPVMTFIYGAGMGNITKSVAESLIIGNSYISGALALGKIDALLKFAEVEGVEPEYKEYVKVDDKMVLQNTDKRDAKYAYLTDWQIGKLTRAINDKISAPFADGFVGAFSEIIEFRQALKTVEQVNYTIFKMKFNEKVAALGKAKMGELTFGELGKIKSEMMKEGTYYSTESAVEGGSIDYWKTGKSDTEQDRISVTINTNDFQTAGGGFSRDYNKIIKELEANIGAIGVTTIHAVDGTIMIEGHTDAVLNVYDAVMMGADFNKNEAQIQNMNKAFYDVNTRHSVLGKAVEKMEHMLEVLGDSKMTPELSVSTMRDLKRIHELGADEGLESVTDNVMTILEKIDSQRRTLVDTKLTINQYAAANDVDGVDSNMHEVDKSGRYAVYGDNTDKAGIKAGLDWLVKSAEEIVKKEEVKAETDTISAEVIAELEHLFKSSDNSVKKIMRDTAKKMAGVDSNQFSVALKELTKDC